MRGAKRASTFATAAALLAALLAAPAVASNSAQDLLRASMDAPRSVSYVGQLQVVRFSSNRANATLVRIEHRAPNLTRRWYLAPQSLYGDYVITRGSATYEFDTKHARVTTSHNSSLDSQVAGSGNLALVLSNYRPILGEPDIIAGRPTTSVVLVNKYTGERAVRVWLDNATHLVMKKEEYHGNGAVASQTRFEEIRYTSAIPDEIFSTSAPDGYVRTAGRDIVMPSADLDRALGDAGFAPAGPKDLPQGFALTGADVASVNGVKTLHLLYSDGLRTLSLFENATGAAANFGTLRPHSVRFEDHDAQYVEDGPTTLIAWKERGLHFALVGDLLRAELLTIAKSVVP